MAHKQFGLELKKRRSHTWVFPRTWRKKDFYRVAAGVIDRYYGDISSELVILGQIPCAIGSGAFLVSLYWGGQTLLWSATRSLLGADTSKECWTTQLLMSDCSNAVYKDCFYSIQDARPLFDDRIH